MVNPGLSGIGLGHLLQGFVHGIIDFGKPGDPHHAKNFFKVVGDAGNSDELIVLFGLGQNLDEYRNTTAVDVDISLSFQQDIARTLIVGIFVSFVQERLGKARYITLDVQQCHGTVLFELDFIFILYFHIVNDSCDIRFWRKLPDGIALIDYSNIDGIIYIL